MNDDKRKRACECGTPSSALRTIFNIGEMDFRRCPSCGLVFREVFPTDMELTEIYRAAYEAEKITHGGTNQESGLFAAQSYADFIQRHVASPAVRVLDYGAGSGELVAQLRARGLRAEGLEFAVEARQFCEERRGFTMLSDLHDVKDGYYDWISMIEVIEHLTELKITLAELHRVLSPGGTLLVTTPNLIGFRARRDGGLWHEAGKKFHLFLFETQSLRFHLAQAGFVGFEQIRFNPLQRPGLKFWLAARLSQVAGLGGTLCMTAVRGGNQE